MADMLSTGAAFLSGQLQVSAAETVTYTRGATAATFAATFGRKLLKTTDVAGRVKVERADADVVFPTAALAGFSPPLPVRGDTVDVTTGGVAQRFTVLAPGGEPHYQYVDPFRVQLRVHLKFQGTL